MRIEIEQLFEMLSSGDENDGLLAVGLINENYESYSNEELVWLTYVSSSNVFQHFDIKIRNIYWGKDGYVPWLKWSSTMPEFVEKYKRIRLKMEMDSTYNI